MLRLSPTKSAKGHTSRSGTANCVLTAIASPMPSRNGSTMLAMLVNTTRRRLALRCDRSSRRPTTNMNSTSPNWLKAFSMGKAVDRKQLVGDRREHPAEKRRSQQEPGDDFPDHARLTHGSESAANRTGNRHDDDDLE